MFGRRRGKGRDPTDRRVPAWHPDWKLGLASMQSVRTDGWQPRPRVLIEQADGALAWATKHALERRGWDVLTCGGPGTIAGGCPLLTEGRCPAAEGADAVLFALPLSDERNAALLRAHITAAGGRPVLVEMTSLEAERRADALDGVRIVSEPVTADAIVGALEEATR